MTDIVHRVPFEIWINVFQHLWYMKKDLCQCRLVCQAWNRPAEKAMFDSGVYPHNKERANKLCQLLLEKPHLARLIKRISLPTIPNDRSGTTSKLLKASFTSNMEYITVDSSSGAKAAFFKALMKAAKDLPNSNYNLKRLPSPFDAKVDRNCYSKAAHFFRQSLNELKISLDCVEMGSVLNKLEGFNSLEKLELTIASLQNVQQLDTVLKNCHCLCELQLKFSSIGNKNYMAQDEASLLRWAAQHVKQVHTLKKVRMDKLCLDLVNKYPFSDLVHYLVYKYPSMESLKCYGMGKYDEGFSLALLNAVKDVDSSTHFCYQQHQELRPSILKICATANMPHKISASFGYSIRTCYSEQFNAALVVETSREDAGKLHLDIAWNVLLSSTVTVDILEDFQKLFDDSYTIDELNVDALSERHRDILKNDEILDFYYIINNFPALTHLQLAIQKIYYQPIITSTRLETLKIELAEMEARVLPQISQQFPRLYLLDINTCSTLKDDQQNQDDIRINVPHSSLALLNVAVKNGFFADVDHHKGMMKKCRKAKACYLQLTLLDVDMTVYCRLERPMTIIQLTQDQFEARPDREDAVAVNVICGSIGRIHFDMIDLLIPQVNVQEFVLRRLQLDMDRLRTKAMKPSSQGEVDTIGNELKDKEQKYNNYLAKSNYFNEKLRGIPISYHIFRSDYSIIKDIAP